MAWAKRLFFFLAVNIAGNMLTRLQATQSPLEERIRRLETITAI
jgi:hypothetical protein